MHRLHYERRWRAGGYALIFVVVLFSLIPRGVEIDIREGDKLGHFFAYGCLMFWFAQLVSTLDRRLRWAIAFVCMGIALEFAQGALGYRRYDPLDMLANAAGVLIGWLLALSLRYAFFARIESVLAHAAERR
jgi:VanZ family protein